MNELSTIRAASLLRVKSVNVAQREISGTASDAEPDRNGTVIMTRGVRYRNPSPLTLGPDFNQPVGQCWFEAKGDAILFRASLPVIEQPGPLRDRVEEAWQSCTTKMISAVNLSLRSLEQEPMPGGTRIVRSELLSLALVAVPLHPNASITGISGIDNALHRALSDNSARKQINLAVAAGDFQRVAELGPDTETIALLVKEFSGGRKAGTAVPVEMFAQALAGSIEHSAQLFRYASARINALERRLGEVAAAGARQ